MRPIRVRLSLVFVLFLLLVAGVGVFSIDRLASFHSVSAQISGRWLQSNRILGDLNNYISDFRGSEGDLLIASTRADLHAAEQEIARPDDIVEGGEARYSRPEHDPAELALFQQFTQEGPPTGRPPCASARWCAAATCPAPSSYTTAIRAAPSAPPTAPCRC